ncbi:terpene synthase family protein [Streptomyces olivoreticuli]|uniref:terpene synthase family protein n=1 Tax=Streptomyces olivoreticuli TaxID=68246 RepID=UPI0026590248|nr:terpene synthase family protein [Streptomyces olivoreticuli]WKK24176.1 terpene synthase family protein [Streptomyces olivoreticuli]
MDEQTFNALRYPFPFLMNPLAETLQKHTDRQWIDGELRHLLSEMHREQIKRAKTAYITAVWYPTTESRKMVPLCRFMLWTLYADDIHEQCTAEQLGQMKERSLAVLRGDATAAEAEVVLGDQLEALRNELLQFLSPPAVSYFAQRLGTYYDGVIREAPYRTSRTHPPLDTFMRIREDSVCIVPFLALIEVETGTSLPRHIHDHPTILRLETLCARLIAWFNDFQSIVKDELSDGTYFNLVKVLQHSEGFSPAGAREKALQIHAEDVTEFIHLQATLPDFGPHHDATVNYVHHISLLPSGWKAMDRILDRYQPTGFAQGEVWKEALQRQGGSYSDGSSC